MSKLANRAFPVYLLGIIGIMTGATETGLAGIMVGDSINDGLHIILELKKLPPINNCKILCDNGIDAKFLITFLNKRGMEEIIFVRRNKL